MYKYGQYCPIAKAVEILGDRWTLLIVRDLLDGICHFNELERGLPGISRGLLARRLRRLERLGLVEKVEQPDQRQRTAYYPTQAGEELRAVIGALLLWGTRHAFEDPEPQDRDPVLLMWWMQNRVCVDALPEQRVVVQFDFHDAKRFETFWLVLSKEDVSVCMTDPGFGIDLVVMANLSAFFQIWVGRLTFAQAMETGQVTVDGPPALADALPGWFLYSLSVPTVRAVAAERAAAQ